jgi:uncharacterized membrane protein YoaK (UPF0700 family)
MDVHSAQHLTSWFLFAGAAGATNVGGFLAARRFVSHVTGTVTDLRMLLSSWALYVDLGAILVAFVAGAMASVIAVDRPECRGRSPRYGLALIAVALLVAAVACAGMAGLFGEFGDAESSAMLAMAVVLSFAMGLQNATVAAATGMSVRTTHLTGPSSDLGVFLGRALAYRDERRRTALRDAWLRFGKLASFAAGAVAMVFVAGRLEFAAFFAPAALVVVATLLTFERAPSARRVSV